MLNNALKREKLNTPFKRSDDRCEVKSFFRFSVNKKKGMDFLFFNVRYFTGLRFFKNRGFFVVLDTLGLRKKLRRGVESVRLRRESFSGCSTSSLFLRSTDL